MIIGRGRAGKDEAGMWFGRNTCLNYKGSTSTVMCPHVALALNIPEEEAWNNRHLSRMFWKQFCDDFRKDDPAVIGRMVIESGADMIIGTRDEVEIKAIQNEGLVDLTIWVERDVPYDPTVEFTSNLADIVIENKWSLDEYYKRLKRFALTVGVCNVEI